jgi:methyltransferase (TIGR00027 family)
MHDSDSLPNAVPKASALRVAIIRAAHQLLDRPVVFEDSLALRILGRVEEERLRRNPLRYNAPALLSLRASLVVRSRLAEEEWARAMQRGVCQFVILGAGLDTYAYRHHGANACQIFEVDLPSTQQWKRECLRAAGIREPAGLTFVPIDFETSSLAAVLAESSFRADQPAFYSWLGVTMYLELEAFINTLQFIASLAPGTGIVFDYAVSPALLSDLERKGVQFVASRAAQQGEPWKLFFEPAAVARTVRSLGFSEVQDFGPDEINARYLAGRKDGLHKSGASRLVSAII